MTPEKYIRVKEIFLAACDKPSDERAGFALALCGDDAEIRREVESLLQEHSRGSKLMPTEPEGPLGPMSAILSRAKKDLGGMENRDRDDAIEIPPDQDRAHDASYMDHSSPSSTTSMGTTSGFVDPGRFAAGTVANGRYRIIELLGRGGMGEVYRADDLMLSQSVALKFLPALFGSDQKWLERFREEVRISRQVTHPNVCRVFDIGEFQGEQFISMEYIDGENLASLLRRIGRLPQDKAIQIGRQLCAGLSAAHDRGVLHRDLKPANVMIDGRGSVRITDFGLAAPVDQMRKEAIRAGTPAYMSPEQLAGKAITVRSDVYALGLVLYEMFTGRRTFRADSLREYQRLHSSEDPTPPSQFLDIDPIVERVIMKCLEKDPKRRPASAMAVSAALPGGNPLREILAAGEIPSPEVVAAAGEAHGAMKPRTAVAAFATALLCMIVFVTMAPKLFVVQQTIRDMEPAVLMHTAQKALEDLGYPAPRDGVGAFAANASYYIGVENDHQTIDRLYLLSRPRSGMVYYWYRQSPDLLVPLSQDGGVTESDPAPVLPGMATVRLDPQGHLIGLEVQSAPPTLGIPIPMTAPAQTTARPAAIDWSPLCKLAEMDLTRFSQVEPHGAPPIYADDRIAWVGSFSDAGDDKVRVEAAAYLGRPVYFAVIGKEAPLSEQRATILSLGQFNLLVQTALVAAMLIAGSWLAFRNLNTGRGDRQGALRMALAFFILGVITWLFNAHHVPDAVYEFLLFQRGVSGVLYVVFLVWIFYMALEPYVRRIWPETVISWSRLLSGNWFDPLVGRDVLAGAAVGTISMLLTLGEFQIPRWLGAQLPLPDFTSTMLILRSSQGLGSLFSTAIVSLYIGLLLLLFLVMVRMITNRRWTASIISILAFATATARYGQNWHFGMEQLMSWGVQILLAILILALLSRHGLVGVIFCLLVRNLLADFPVSWDLSAWYRPMDILAMLSVILILATGCYAAVGGKGFLLGTSPDRPPDTEH